VTSAELGTATTIARVSDAPGPVTARNATPADVDAVTAAFTTAFFNDPVWAPVFPDESRRAEQSAPMWRVYAVAALRYPWTFVTPGAEAAAVWIPPGGTELTGEETGRLGEVIAGAAGPEAAASAREIEARLEAGHPGGSFFHLTILATHAGHRGKGLGMALLAETLTRIDAMGAPAYLESTNPVNIPRYMNAGFEPCGEITMATGHIVTAMWRPAR
jgi:GNAT superfamily N-acetyltransferase